MTQQPFSRPGAVDLSGLKRPAAGAPPGPAGGGEGAPAGGSYWLDVTQDNFQATVEASLTAPVLLAFYSASRLPESAQMADDLATVAGEFEGRFLAGLVDVDAQPAIAQAVQLQSVPFVFAVIDGRPQPLIQDVLTLDNLRGAINQVMQQLTTQGITGRHQPRQAAAPVGDVDEDGEPPLDPRYAPAQDALERNDFDGAVAEYQKLLDRQPGRRRGRGRPRHGHPAAADRRRRPRPPRARPRPPAPTTSPPRPWSQTSTCSPATSTRPSTGWSTSYVVRRATSATRRASTCSACSPPSATRTRGCSRAGRTWPQPCSDSEVVGHLADRLEVALDVLRVDDGQVRSEAGQMSLHERDDALTGARQQS